MSLGVAATRKIFFDIITPITNTILTITSTYTVRVPRIADTSTHFIPINPISSYLTIDIVDSDFGDDDEDDDDENKSYELPWDEMVFSSTELSLITPLSDSLTVPSSTDLLKIVIPSNPSEVFATDQTDVKTSNTAPLVVTSSTNSSDDVPSNPVGAPSTTDHSDFISSDIIGVGPSSINPLEMSPSKSLEEALPSITDSLSDIITITHPLNDIASAEPRTTAITNPSNPVVEEPALVPNSIIEELIDPVSERFEAPHSHTIETETSPNSVQEIVKISVILFTKTFTSTLTSAETKSGKEGYLNASYPNDFPTKRIYQPRRGAYSRVVKHTNLVNGGCMRKISYYLMILGLL